MENRGQIQAVIDGWSVPLIPEPDQKWINHDRRATPGQLSDGALIVR